MEHFNVRNESQLAKQVGMAQTTVNKLITGVSADPRISTLTPIAEHFKIPLDTLLSENPSFTDIKENAPKDLFIPVLSYDELADIYDDLEALNMATWPYWYPIPQQDSQHYYGIRLTPKQLLKPFEQTSLLIIKNEPKLNNNTHCLVKHLSSNSINIKQVFFENGKPWLLPLQAELPTIEFNQEQWQLLGSIQARITDMVNGNFIRMEEGDKDE